jgi:hypothetical protein
LTFKAALCRRGDRWGQIDNAHAGIFASVERQRLLDQFWYGACERGEQRAADTPALTARPQTNEVTDAGRALGLQLNVLNARNERDIDTGFATNDINAYSQSRSGSRSLLLALFDNSVRDDFFDHIRLSDVVKRRANLAESLIHWRGLAKCRYDVSNADDLPSVFC